MGMRRSGVVWWAVVAWLALNYVFLVAVAVARISGSAVWWTYRGFEVWTTLLVVWYKILDRRAEAERGVEGRG